MFLMTTTMEAMVFNEFYTVETFPLTCIVWFAFVWGGVVLYGVGKKCDVTGVQYNVSAIYLIKIVHPEHHVDIAC